MKIKADFFADWVELLKDILVSHWGYDISSVPDAEIPFVYFNAEQRRPDQKLREVVESDSFICPPEQVPGWDRLKTLIESDQDITPNLSKLVNNLNSKDSMLNDWGVHHFHLGEHMEGKFTKRTGPLLFALLADDKFYAIGVFEHGSWADQDIVEIVHRNWPDVVDKYKIKGVVSSTEVTEKERKNLRSKNVNAFVTVGDGTVYAPIGGGMVSSGYNVQAVMTMHKQKAMLKDLEDHLNKQMDNLRGLFEQQGYQGEPVLEATLEISDKEYRAFFPKYGVSAILLSKA